MKLQGFFLTLAVLTISSQYVSAEQELGNLQFDPVGPIIKKLIEKIIQKIPETVHIPKFVINLPVPEVAEGNFTLLDLVATGLNKWDTDVKTKLLSKKLNLSINIEEVNVHNDYISNMLFMNLIPVYGNGPNNINLQNLSFNLSSSFTLNNGLTISNTSFVVTIGKLTFDVHQFLNNQAFSAICGQILNDVIAKFVNDHQKFITKMTSPVIEKLVNTILHPKKNDTNVYKREENGSTTTLTLEKSMESGEIDEKSWNNYVDEIDSSEELLVDSNELLENFKENLDSLEDLSKEEKAYIKMIKSQFQ